MFVLVVLLWFVMFWISRRKNAQFIGKTPDSDFFVGKVSSDTREDLTRGRMSFTDSDIIFVAKHILFIVTITGLLFTISLVPV